MVNDFQQYEVYWISLDPTQGSEIAKSRPCVIVSPNELNQFLRTLIIIPITSTVKKYPWRVACTVSGRGGSIAADQIRAVDKTRLGSKIGKISKKEVIALKEVMQKMLVN